MGLSVDEIPDSLIEEVAERVRLMKTVRRTLPGGGRLHIDRRVPFLCVCRTVPGEPGEEVGKLIAGEAAYLIAPAEPGMHPSLERLVAAIAEVIVESAGGFLLLELWPAVGSPDGNGGARVPGPTFRIVTASLPPEDATVRRLHGSLAAIPLRPPPLDVEIVSGAPAPPGRPPLLPEPLRSKGRCHAIGIEVQPVYRQARTGVPYPVLFETLHRGLSLAFRQTAYHFTLLRPELDPPHYHALGRRTSVRAAGEADIELTRIARSFDFLLQVTPVNVMRERAEFLRTGGNRAPVFDYRPLVVDVDALKRDLYNLPIDQLEDPTLSQLLARARDQLARKITMLGDRNTPRFLYGSLGVYGGVEPELKALARELVDPDRRPPGTELEEDGEDADDAGPETVPSPDRVDAKEFARMAAAEVELYRMQYPGLESEILVREDVTGLLVTKGRLLVGSRFNVSRARARALIQHEVGTHVLTYSNGEAQPLGQLATGLAGYEETQEGLAVMAEHLVGGLTPDRMRVLAARVLAVEWLISGAEFVEAYRELTRAQRFRESTAFTICMRVYRSGGLTKDAIYLRGLTKLLAYLRRDGNLNSLLLGKLSLADVPAIEELRWREYLHPPRILPRYLGMPGAVDRIARLRGGQAVQDLARRADG